MIDLSRNHLIEAGAGTGKTYTLIRALLQALCQKRIPLTQIVALTFTKKAAGEMKERVADELRRLLDAPTLPDEYRSWGYSLEELQAVARQASDDIDRANISTIHSFAFTILKRYPLLAGINPQSEVDEKGIRYGECFDAEWPRFLARELQENSPHAADWLEILSRVSLSEIESLARELSDFEVPVSALPLRDGATADRIALLHEQVRELAAAHASKDRAGRAVRACEEILGAAATCDDSTIDAISPEVAHESRLSPNKTKAWSDDEWQALKLAQKVARNVLLRGDRVITLLSERLKPFIVGFRANVLSEGYLSNSALLALAGALVRKNHDVRAALQREYQMIFIDEFQDTDPRQGELLLFLAEKPGGHARRWQDIALEPGKLFVVGDPKQSIYRFRGADITAYRQIAELLTAQGGVATPLIKSFRSHAQIIHTVNHAFAHLMQGEGPHAPPYIPLEPLREREGLPIQEVELVLADSGDAQLTKDARQTEASAVAEWIADHVARLECPDTKEGRRPLRYRDIALVFRATHAMRPFVDALRERDIPFVVEGERYFYSMPEVTDLLNGLRALDNPLDRLSLVGFLRSPLGGFTDPDILRLKELRALDFRRPLPPGYSEGQRHLWSLLKRFHGRVAREPLRVLLGRLFEESFVLELAARSYHREQTVANVLKLKRLLETFAEEGVTTLRALLDKVDRFMDRDRLEGESPLADETFDAVRLLTIHKAKGLEFPVVMLPSLHSGHVRRTDDPVIFDWMSGRLGLRAGALQNLDKFFMDADAADRETEEAKRVLYVAMTRARERLVLSGGIHLSRPSGHAYLEWLRSAWGLHWDSVAEGVVAVGNSEIRIRLAKPQSAPLRVIAPDSSDARLTKLNAKSFTDQWRDRAQTAAAAFKAPAIITPSTAAKSFERLDAESTAYAGAAPESGELVPAPDDALLLGTLVHRFMERWDFKRSAREIPETLSAIFDHALQSLGLRATDQWDALQRDARQMLETFLASEISAPLSKAAILGRELPFFFVDAHHALVRGSMDILYRGADGVLTVGDYKTDRLTSGTTPSDAGQHYHAQGTLYREAVRRALAEDVRFQLIFLRAPAVVDLADVSGLQ